MVGEGDDVIFPSHDFLCARRLHAQRRVEWERGKKGNVAILLQLAVPEPVSSVSLVPALRTDQRSRCLSSEHIQQRIQLATASGHAHVVVGKTRAVPDGTRRDAVRRVALLNDRRFFSRPANVVPALVAQFVVHVLHVVQRRVLLRHLGLSGDA